MRTAGFLGLLHQVFEDKSLYAFSSIDEGLAERAGCKCALVTLQPYPDLEYQYNALEFYDMLEELRREHSGKLKKVKAFLDEKGIRYETPPAAPKDDDSHLAEFSYKWAAIHAGLGFIGKNDVFVHHKYAQRVRISCLLINAAMPCYTGEIQSGCRDCDSCVRACPHGFIRGNTWNETIRREELIDYKRCATKSKHSGSGQMYLCARCTLACKYPYPIR